MNNVKSLDGMEKMPINSIESKHLLLNFVTRSVPFIDLRILRGPAI